MLNCRDASRLMSDEIDRKLAFGERIALRMHLLLCAACLRVEGQLRFLGRAVSALAKADPNPK